MKKLKIGIIGVGRLGYEHACNIANRVPGSELVAIADANFDRAKQVAEELGVTAVYNDPKALCDALSQSGGRHYHQHRFPR